MQLGRFLRVAALGVILGGSLGSPATARWAAREDFDHIVEFQNNEYVVRADGSYDLVTETQLQITKETGKSRLSVDRITYNPSSSSVQVLAAKSIVDGREFPVPSSSIEDKPSASSAAAFDQQRQIMVAFPQVAVGARTYLKLRFSFKRVPVPGFFSAVFLYGAGQFEAAGTTTIRSALPLFSSKNDPDGKLDIVSGRDGSAHTLKITLKTPVFKSVIDEPSPFIGREILTSAEVASSQDWGVIHKKMREGFESVQGAPLPQAFSEILEEARHKATLEEQAGYVATRITSVLNYLGNWQTIEGQFAPRRLSEVAASRQGDCKDFSSVTVAILRALGIQADVALTWFKRGGAWDPNGFQEVPYGALPTPMLFNHAIVRVKAGDRVYWLDPTNFVGHPSVIPMPIAGERVLSLGATSSQLEQLPVPGPDSSVSSLRQTVRFSDLGVMEAEGTLTLSGRGASHLADTARRTDKRSLDAGIAQGVSGGLSLSWWHVEGYDFSSRTPPGSVDLSFKYVAQNVGLRTTTGPAFVLVSDPRIRGLAVSTASRVSGLQLGEPAKFERRFRVEGLTTVGSQPLDCWVMSQWLEASRSVKRGTREFEIHDSLELKRHRIDAKELRSVDFSVMQHGLLSCFGNSAVVYEPKSGDRLADSRSAAPVPSPSPTRQPVAAKQVKGVKAASLLLLRELLAAVTGRDGGELSSAEKVKVVEGFARVAKVAETQASNDPFVQAKNLVERWKGDNQDLMRAKNLLEENLDRHPSHAPSLVVLAWVAVDLGMYGGGKYASENLKKGNELIERALRLDPSLADAFAARAWFRHLDGAEDAALEDARKAVSLDASCDGAHRLLGKIALGRKKPEEAIIHLKQAVELAKGKNTETRGYELLAEAYETTKQPVQADEAYRQVFALEPKNHWAHHNYSLLLLGRKDFDGAISESSAALALADFGAARGVLSNALYSKGAQLYWGQKNHEVGADLFKKVLEVAPQHSNANYGLGIYYLGLANEKGQLAMLPRAREHLERALATNPGHGHARKAMETLNRSPASAVRK